MKTICCFAIGAAMGQKVQPDTILHKKIGLYGVVPDTIKVRVLIDDGRAYPTQVNAWLFYSNKQKGDFSEIDAVYLEQDKKKRITSHVWLFHVYNWR